MHEALSARGLQCALRARGFQCMRPHVYDICGLTYTAQLCRLQSTTAWLNAYKWGLRVCSDAFSIQKCLKCTRPYVYIEALRVPLSLLPSATAEFNTGTWVQQWYMSSTPVYEAVHEFNTGIWGLKYPYEASGYEALNTWGLLRIYMRLQVYEALSVSLCLYEALSIWGLKYMKP